MYVFVSDSEGQSETEAILTFAWWVPVARQGNSPPTLSLYHQLPRGTSLIHPRPTSARPVLPALQTLARHTCPADHCGILAGNGAGCCVFLQVCLLVLAGLHCGSLPSCCLAGLCNHAYCTTGPHHDLWYNCYHEFLI